MNLDDRRSASGAMVRWQLIIQNYKIQNSALSFNLFDPPLDFLTGFQRHDDIVSKGIARRGGPRFFDQSDTPAIPRQAIEVGAVERRKGLESIEGAGGLEDLGIEGEGGVGAEATGATAAFSLVDRPCGALSVPRKNRGSPPVAAATRASRWISLLSTGRQ